MYFAEYGDGENAVRQWLLRFPPLTGTAASDPRTRESRLEDLGRRLRENADVDFTLRLACGGSGLERQLFLNATRAPGDFPEAILGDLVRSGAGEGEVAHPCATRSEHDAAVDALPPLCLSVAGEPARHGDCAIAHEFRLLDAMSDLMRAALRAGAAICWQAAFRSFRADADARRVVRRNVIALEHAAGVPEALREQQRALATRFDAAAYLIHDCLWVDAAFAPMAEEIVRRTWRNGPGRHGHPVCSLERLSGNALDIARAALHPALFEAPSPFEQANAAVSAEEAIAALTWLPSAGAATGSDPAPAAGDAAAAYLIRIEQRLRRIEQELARRGRTGSECDDLRKAMGISRQDAAFALVKARQILEKLVRRLYRQHRPNGPDKPLLFDMIRDLAGHANRPAVLPKHIANYLDTIRVLGNLEAHKDADGEASSAVSDSDVELSLLMTLNILEWYLLEDTVAQGGAGSGAA